MGINESIFQSTMNAAKTGKTVDKKIAMCSHKISMVVRYLELSVPGYSRSKAIDQKLSLVMAEHQPELWDMVKSNVQETKENTESRWDNKEITRLLKHPDTETLYTAYQETQTISGKTVTVYSPRLAAIFKYLHQTTPRFVMSQYATGLLEEKLSIEYPVIWKKISNMTSTTGITS